MKLKIAELRDKADITQLELGTAVGLSQPHISAIEIGAKTPSLDTAKRIADVLHCKVDDLIAE